MEIFMGATQTASAPVTASRLAGTKRFLNAHEASEYLGVGHSTLSIHRMKGTGPAYIKWGGNVRYDICELDRFMAEQTVNALPAQAEKRRVGRPRKEGK
jgi:predicted DNA-binding transcriptional regulator AlpA